MCPKMGWRRLDLMRRMLLALLAVAVSGCALLSPAVSEKEEPTLKQPVDILFDRWGVPHIYAKDTYDLFFTQGWITARDRLFQLDLWRRIGSGHLAEVLGPSAVKRDRMARLLRYRGNWDAEWASYAPDTKEIVTAFVDGINAYIRALGGQRPVEFKVAGYDPGKWTPEDVVSRVAGLSMMLNVESEVRRSEDVVKLGLEKVQKYMPPDPYREQI